MPITINGSGTVTGISAGGLPDDCITTAKIAANAVTAAKLGADQASGLAKAWVNFNGTGTVAIRAGFNVSSITDNGTGDYTVNFTTAMVDANYCPVGMAVNENSAQVVMRHTATAQTVSACRVRLEEPGVAAGDGSQVNVAFFR